MVKTTEPLTVSQAKRLVTSELNKMGVSSCSVRGRTVDFTDLARARCIFVDVVNWSGNCEQWQQLREFAVKNGFRMEPKGIG